MTREEYLSLSDDGPAIIRGRMLADQTDRTLIMGTDSKRMNWHVYLLGGKIHCLVYNFNGDCINYFNEDVTDNAKDFIPTRNLHPETCDFIFMRILKRLGLTLVFTRFNEGRPQITFFGLVLDQVNPQGD